ncbi:MAG: exodeoxyribonuclease VII large subunit [Bacteroidaceae bacterium]|nr:exodeoxyribonuclease VII large subunit [Bacteroidaceae bacterium]
MDKTLSLLELNSLASAALGQALPGRYNIVAEISEISGRSGGHCYLTLIEKGALGDTVAKAPAHIWRNRWANVSAQFVRATGQALAAGMKVLAVVEVELHTQYGYSLNVLDIDASYTMGEQARRRQETILRLKADGVYDMNRELPLPRPLTRVAVVSSATAAGYGDFCRQLEQSGYPIRPTLFEAVVQGTSAPTSVIRALERIEAVRDDFDAVVIIRGGGATDDLVCFDDYDLASAVAQASLPVLTGIGHERDTSVTDMVACRAFKTPTAVAAFLIDRHNEELRTIDDLMARLSKSVSEAVNHHTLLLRETSARLQIAAKSLSQAERLRTERLRLLLSTATRSHLGNQRQRLATLGKQVALLDPQNVLERGYSLTTCGGHVVRRASDLHHGDVLLTRFGKGTAQSRVEIVTEE